MNYSTKTYYGPNIYAKKPIIIFNIPLDAIDNEILAKTSQKLEELFVNYVEKDIITTSNINLKIGKLITSFALSIINKNKGVARSYGVQENKKGIVCWIEFDSIELTHKALELSIQIFFKLLQNKTLTSKTIDQLLNKYLQSVRAYTNYYFELFKGSKELDIPSFQYYDSSLYRQYGWGKNSRVFRGSSPIEDSYNGVEISRDKLVSKALLKSIGVPVAEDVTIISKNQLPQAIAKIDYPCVVKPIRGSQGRGITTNIRSFEELEAAYNYAKKSTYEKTPIMIEKFIEGDDFRLMVINGKFIGAIKRIATMIKGDGKSTIKTLIKRINIVRSNPSTNQNKLKLIKINDKLIKHLNTYNFTLDSVLGNNFKLPLNSVANYSDGGIIEDATDQVHPEIIQMCEAIAQVTQIYNLGIDYISNNIAKSYYETKGAVTEYNHYTTIFPSHYLKISSKLLNNCGRIPITLLIVNEVQTIQMLNYLKDKMIDNNIGWYCKGEVYLGNLPLIVYDRSGWENIKLLLRQKTVGKILIVATSKEIIDKGLPVDRFDTIYYENIVEEWKNVLDQSTLKLNKYTNLNELIREESFLINTLKSNTL